MKILDFGLAKLAGQVQLTKDSSTLGTVAYMSPEQAKGETVDHRTDIWSVGVVLYEMITGLMPFKGEFDQAVIYSIMNELPEPMTILRSGIPPELERIVIKCLTKDKEGRYQHSDELLVNLKKLQTDMQLPKDGVSIRKGIQENKRKPLRLILVSGGIILFIGMIVTTLYLLSGRSNLPVKRVPETLNHGEWENSIAVLPFENISPDPEQEYFCDGITEQIITNLSRLQRLKVIARTSVMNYKDTQKTIPEIGEELGVSNILEGSVRKIDSRIRITAQLVKTDGGYNLWVNDYSRELDDIFGIQDEVSEAIAGALLNHLTREEVDKIKTDRPQNSQIYDQYLKAKTLHDKFLRLQDTEYLQDATVLLEGIVHKEPEYLNANLELANVYNSFLNMVAKTDKEKNKYVILQDKYIEKAYRLNQKSADVLFIKALVYEAKYGDKHFIADLRGILQIDPNHPRANRHLGFQLEKIGLIDKSLKYYNKALEFDPLFTWNYSGRGGAYTRIGEYEKAKRDFENGLKIEPDDYTLLQSYITLEIMQKNIEHAEKLFLRLKNRNLSDLEARLYKSFLSAVKGDSLSAMRSFEKSRGGDRERIALYSILGLKQKALELMLKRQNEQVGEIHFSEYLQYKNLPWYDNLRDDKQFIKVLVTEKERYNFLQEKYSDM